MFEIMKRLRRNQDKNNPERYSEGNGSLALKRSRFAPKRCEIKPLKVLILDQSENAVVSRESYLGCVITDHWRKG
jgi:hypothetical protein